MPNKITLLVFWLISKFLPRDKNLWVYAEGDNNSALPLLKYAKTQDNRQHIYITPFKTQIAKLKKQGILAFKQSSLLGCYYITRAKVVIIANDSLADVNKYLTSGTLIINVFHGIPIKNTTIEQYNHKMKNTQTLFRTLSYHRKNQRCKRRLNNQILLCSTSELTQQLFSRCFGVDKDRLPIVGESRNDVLFSDKTNREHIIQNISPKMRDFTTIFAYTPTWRDEQSWDMDIDFAKMNSFLLQHNCALIVRPHHFDKTFENLDNTLSNIFISDSYHQEYNDVYDELVGVDVLISDYSSLIYEFLITNRPVLIYTPDYHNFRQMRGFLVDFDSHIPSKRLNNHQELMHAMLDVINGNYNKDKYNKIQNMFHQHIDGNSAKRVYKKINSILE